MRIDHVHMTQQVNRFEANCGEHGVIVPGAYKGKERATNTIIGA